MSVRLKKPKALFWVLALYYCLKNSFSRGGYYKIFMCLSCPSFLFSLAIKVLLSHVESGDASGATLSPPGEPAALPPHSLNCNSLKRLASRDVWCVQAEQLWLEFLGAPANKNRPVPFVEALPVTLWLSLAPGPAETGRRGEPVLNGTVGKGCELTNVTNNQNSGPAGGARENGRSDSHPVTFKIGSESPASQRRGGDGDRNGTEHRGYQDQQQQQSHHLMSASPMMPVLGTSPPFSGSPLRDERAGTGASGDENGGHSSSRAHSSNPRDRGSSREGRGNGKPRYNSLDRRQQGVELNESAGRGRYSDEGERTSKSEHFATNSSYQGNKSQSRGYRYEEAVDDQREGNAGQWDRDHGSQGTQRPRSNQRPVRRDSSAHGSVEGRQRYNRHIDDGDPSYAKGRERVSGESIYGHRDQHGTRRDGSSHSLQRQDSRSSSSPPRQCEETRERRGRERKLRHSSSSSSEKRDPDAVTSRVTSSRSRGGDVLESRSSAEGQVSSDSVHGLDERHIRKDKRGGEDHFSPSDKRHLHGGVEEFSTTQDTHRSNSRVRHSSESPDWSSGGGPARHRHLQRSSSRDSRSSRESTREEFPRRSPRGTDVAKRSASRDSQAGRRLTREPSRDSTDGRWDSADQLTKPVAKSRRGVSRSPAPLSGEDDGGGGAGSSWGEDDGNGGRRGGRRGGGAVRQNRSQSRGPERGDTGGSSGHRYPFPASRGEHPVDIPRPRCLTDEVDDSISRRGPTQRNYDADCDNDIFNQGGAPHNSMDPAASGSRDVHTDGSGGRLPREQASDAVEDRHRGSQSRSRQEAESTEVASSSGWGGHQDSSLSGWSQQHQRPPPDGCKSSQSQEDEEDDDARLADSLHGKRSCNSSNSDQKMCVLLQVGSKLRVQLNHFQFVFLLRLAESFAAFQNDLSADLLSLASTQGPVNSSRTSSTTTSSSKPAAPSSVKPSVKQEPSSAMVIPIVLKEVEFAVVCPYQMHQRTFSDDFSILSPFLQGVTSGQDAVFGEDGEMGSTSCFPQFSDSIGKSKSQASIPLVCSRP